MQTTSLTGWCKFAARKGYTHILDAAGNQTDLQSIVNKQAKFPPAPKGTFWAGDGTSEEFRVALFSKTTGQKLGHLKFVKN